MVKSECGDKCREETESKKSEWAENAHSIHNKLQVMASDCSARDVFL